MWDLNLDFNQLYGAGSGAQGQDAADIMAYLGNLLQTQAGTQDPWHYGDWEQNWANLSGGEGANAWSASNWSLQEWANFLESNQDTSFGGDLGEGQAKQLLGLLNQTGLVGQDNLAQGYNIASGDISAGTQAGLAGLRGQYGSQLKSGRYGGLGTGSRGLQGGGRQKYEADVYGLLQQQQTAQQDLQTDLSDQFYSNIGTWQDIYG